MRLNRLPDRAPAHRLAAVATTICLAVMASLSPRAQTLPFQLPLPACYVPPSPGTDRWPVAVNDDLGSTPEMPVTFSRATLVANDTGTSLTVSSVDATTANGG